MCGNPKIGLCKINTCSTKKGKLMAPRKEKLMDLYIIVNMNIAFLFIISDIFHSDLVTANFAFCEIHVKRAQL